MLYVDGFVVAVPTANQAPYQALSAKFAPLFKGFGANRHVEAWGDDVPAGERTDMRRAVMATDDETVVFSFIEYPDKATRDAANAKIMDDPSMHEMAPETMPFDGSRMIYAGFEGLVDTGAASGATAYIDGTAAPADPAAKAAYTAYAQRVADKLVEQGALRVVEAWGADIAPGKLTDFRKAVAAQDGEAIVFSWVEWPSKAVRDAAWGAIMADPSLTPTEAEIRKTDNQRRIYGGFTPILDA